MAHEDFMRGDRTPAHGRLPVDSVWRRIHLARNEVEDAVDDVVLVRDVVVKRHRLHFELLGELAHAERIDAAFVREGHGRAQHALPAQGRSSRSTSVRLSGHSVEP